MKALSAGLTFVSISTVCGLLFGIGCRGLDVSTAIWSLMLGGFAAIIAYWSTSDPAKPAEPAEIPPAEPEPAPRLSKRAQRRMEKSSLQPTAPPKRGYRNIWLWIMAAFFAIFAVRSFCWLLYIDSGELKIQSPNNLGDLSLHITYIRNFANGVPLWPDNPIYVFSKMRYPAGIDLFNALLLLADVDLIPGLVWVGILASIATCYAFYRWGGAFGIAGFLFNGGLAGFQFLSTHEFKDYQGVNDVAWKSIPLSMFVTQRGLLYAIPAGLFLLWHWRQKFFRDAAEDRQRTLLPFWTEVALYASMPLFHVHTFMALSIVLVFLFIFGDRAMQRHTFRLVACSFLPATLFVWLITDHFNAGSVLQWWPGWVLHNKAGNEFHHAFFWFWLWNFGLFMPLLLVLFGVVGSRVWESGIRFGKKAPEDFIFLAAAVFIFLLGFFFKTAPWEWDNLKLMIWGYFIVLPYLWKDLISLWRAPARAAICIALFASGFVTLFGGLAAGRTGFGFVQRAELDGIGVAVRKLPAEARFATFPIFNHPILLQGRKVVLGYPGHLWTQGFDYGDAQNKLTQLMNGASNWRENARALGVRYIFWGNFEKTNYPASTRPWEKDLPRVAGDGWGAIYDLGPTP